MTWQTEFPDFPAADMPAEVQAWDDISWHNDMCPSFVPGPNLTVWVDYADDAMRDFPGGQRFSVIPTDNEGCLLGDIGEKNTLHTDNWGDVLTYVSNALNERI